MMKQRFVSRILCLMLFVGIAVSANAQNGMDPLHVAKTKSVTGVYLSEDGKTAAYTVSVPADPFKENALASTHLYLLDVATGESKPFITGSSVSGVAFRPGHNSITFLDKKSGDGTRSIYEISLNGGEAQKLFAFKTNIVGYEWGNDGEHVLFRASQPVEKTDNPLPYAPEIYEENLHNTWAYMQNVGKE